MRWRVTNNSPTGHLWSIEARGVRVHIAVVPLLLAAALVTIRIYNYAGTPPTEIAAAQAAGDRIFRDAGLSVQWVLCRVPNFPAGAACTEPLRNAGEYVLRLQTSTAAAVPSHVGLGASLIDVRTGSGVLITIDPRLVHAVASQAGTDPAVLLARAIAHEVGHLLIGSPTHSPHGLMRALWSQQELRQNRAEDWTFSADETVRMRHSLTQETRELGN